MDLWEYLPENSNPLPEIGTGNHDWAQFSVDTNELTNTLFGAATEIAQAPTEPVLDDLVVPSSQVVPAHAHASDAYPAYDDSTYPVSSLQVPTYSAPATALSESPNVAQVESHYPAVPVPASATAHAEAEYSSSEEDGHERDVESDSNEGTYSGQSDFDAEPSEEDDEAGDEEEDEMHPAGYGNATAGERSPSPGYYDVKVPSVSLLSVPKRDSFSVLGRQYYEKPTAIYREAHSEVFIVTKKEKSRGEEFKVFAIKRQHLKDPDDLTDKAYRELRILLQLSKLQRHHVCANFVFLRDWHKSTPPLMFPTKQDYGPNDQFLNFELEYADHSLPALKEVTLLEFKVILFQIIYALYVAQRYFKLVHNDLHSKNILLQEMDPRSPYMAFHDLDRIWYGRKYIVKITDFGLSRLQLESTREVVYNPKNSFDELFSSTRDLEKVAGEIHKVKIQDWASASKQDRDNLGAIKSKMKLGKATAFELLREPFFDELMQRPADASFANTSMYSSDGELTTVQRAVAGQPVDLPDLPPELLKGLDASATYEGVARFAQTVRATRAHQSNVYVTYVPDRKDLTIKKKKKKRLLQTDAPPRPRSPKRTKERVPKPFPPPPPPPQEPLTREERREHNQTVNVFRETNKILRGEIPMDGTFVLGSRRTKEKALENLRDDGPPLRLPPPVPVAERAVAPRPAKAPAEPFKRRTHGGDWVKLNRNETDHDDDSVIIDGSSRDEDDEDEGNTHPRLVPDGLFATAANPDVPQITAAQVTTTVPYVRVASTLPTPIAQFAQVLSSEDLSESRPDPVLPQIRASVGPTNVPKASPTSVADVPPTYMVPPAPIPSPTPIGQAKVPAPISQQYEANIRSQYQRSRGRSEESVEKKPSMSKQLRELEAQARQIGRMSRRKQADLFQDTPSVKAESQSTLSPRPHPSSAGNMSPPKPVVSVPPPPPPPQSKLEVPVGSNTKLSCVSMEPVPVKYEDPVEKKISSYVFESQSPPSSTGSVPNTKEDDPVLQKPVVTTENPTLSAPQNMHLPQTMACKDIDGAMKKPSVASAETQPKQANLPSLPRIPLPPRHADPVLRVPAEVRQNDTIVHFTPIATDSTETSSSESGVKPPKAERKPASTPPKTEKKRHKKPMDSSRSIMSPEDRAYLEAKRMRNPTASLFREAWLEGLTVEDMTRGRSRTSKRSAERSGLTDSAATPKRAKNVDNADSVGGNP